LPGPKPMMILGPFTGTQGRLVPFDRVVLHGVDLREDLAAGGPALPRFVLLLPRDQQRDGLDLTVAQPRAGAPGGHEEVHLAGAQELVGRHRPHPPLRRDGRGAGHHVPRRVDHQLGDPGVLLHPRPAAVRPEDQRPRPRAGAARDALRDKVAHPVSRTLATTTTGDLGAS